MLQTHQLAKHTANVNPMTCNECGKTFKIRKYLYQHSQTHIKTGYSCPMCPDQKFSFAAAVRSHIKLHHPELPQPPRGTYLKNYDWTKELANL